MKTNEYCCDNPQCPNYHKDELPKKSLAPGYYTIQGKSDDEKPTVCFVSDRHEIDILGYCPGYTMSQVCGDQALFNILAGPWWLPVSKDWVTEAIHEAD